MKKKFFYTNIIAVIIVMTLVCTFNYLLDPYGIFKSDFSKQVLEPNKNYIKTKYILNNQDKYDSFIFGSSRVGALEGELLKNGRYYNMTYSEGLPKDWLNNIKTFLNNGIEIKNILIALDDFSFTADPNDHLSQPMRIPYENLNKFKIFSTYLFRDPFDLYNKETIKGMSISKYDGSNFDLYNTGRGFTTFKQEQEKLKALTPENLNSDIYNKPTIFFDYNRVDETINEIKEIKELCTKNNINLYVIFNPLHKTTYLATDKAILEDAKNKVSEITDFWDFTGLNEITENNYYWAETSHYRLLVGRMILEKVFSIDLGVECPDDFGTYITRKE